MKITNTNFTYYGVQLIKDNQFNQFNQFEEDALKIRLDDSNSKGQIATSD